MKRLSLLLAFSIVAAALVIGTGAWPTIKAEPGDSNAVATGEDSIATERRDSVTVNPEVIAYYFHTTARCASCKKIEAYTVEAIETGFADEIEAGKLTYQAINIDLAENEHFIKDYQLYAKAVVICDMDGATQVAWKNLNRVWELIINKDDFTRYVQDEIAAYLKES